MPFTENYQVDTATITDYEIERDKPMPSRNHSLIQTRILVLLDKDYGEHFSFPSELDLEILPKGATPDICIYPKMKIDLDDSDVIKMTELPLTAIEILSPKQALDDLVEKARKRYFPNGIKSVWLVFPSLRTFALVTPENPVRYFTEGVMTDPATNIKIDVQKAFIL